MKKEVVKYYGENGYTRTLNYIKELNVGGKISLKDRGELEELIAHIELQPKRNKMKNETHNRKT